MNGWMNLFIYFSNACSVETVKQPIRFQEVRVTNFGHSTYFILKLFCDFPHSLQQPFEMLPQYCFLFPSNFYFIYAVYLML